MSDTSSFELFDFREEIKAALAQQCFDQPTPIQAQSIGPILAGRHVIGQAQTGTGKTAAFVLPILERLDLLSKQTQALIVAPTRELAAQIAECVASLGANIHGLNVATIYGGQSYPTQKKALKKGAHIIVATPGRFIDLFKQGVINMKHLQMLVLDEADEMLSMGFLEDIELIYSHTPELCQRTLFSATISTAVVKIANRYLQDPLEIRLGGNRQKPADRITQKYLRAKNQQQVIALAQLMELESPDGAIVFVKTKQLTSEVAEILQTRGLRAEAINGDMAQSLREMTVERLKSGLVDVLVATDVVARGLDVRRISHVFNLGLPTNPDTYIHRIGRSGRAGRLGCAISIISHAQTRALAQIEKHTGQKIIELVPPTPQQLREHRIGKLYENIHMAFASQAATDHSVLELSRQLLASMQPEEALCAVISAWQGERLTVVEQLEESKPVSSRDHKVSGGKKRGRKNDKKPVGEFLSYRIPFGRDLQLKAGGVVGALVNEGGLRPKDVGNIKVKDNYAVVELSKRIQQPVLGKLSRIRLRRRELILKPIKIKKG